MAARTNPTYRLRMWDYARLRLRDVLATPWDPPLRLADGTAATIGDLFTSERAVAILLRWHVNRPADLLPLVGRPAGISTLVLAYQDARRANPAGSADWAQPSLWNDVNEATLCDALYARKPAAADNWLRRSLIKVYEWPNWLDDNEYEWALPVDEVLPTIVGLANAQVAVGAQHVAPFTIDWVGPPGVVAATSSNHRVADDADVVIGGAAPNHTITVTPNGPAGRTRITVLADSDNGHAEATFTLTVGNPGGGAPPAPASLSRLSKLRGSFRLDATGLPA
jgi:hypothetical protein